MPLISFPSKNTFALLFQIVSRGVTKTESVSLVWESCEDAKTKTVFILNKIAFSSEFRTQL